MLELSRHPGWGVLKNRWQAFREAKASSLATYLLADIGPVDQNKIDKERGQIRGGDWFIKQVERGVRAFEKQQKEGES